MRVIAKPIDVVAWFDKEGVHPVRFRTALDGSEMQTIIINKILYTDKEKLAGNPMMKFTCQSIINGIQKTYEIKYELDTMKWILFKM